MKGQMFFIAAIFMVIGFVLLRGILSLPEISQEKAFHESSYLDRNMHNLVNEYNHVAGAASMVNVNTSASQFYNFSSYVRGELDSRILYVFIISNGTSRNFSATIGNFLQGNISGTISFTGSTPAAAGFVMSDRTNLTYYFNSTGSWINVTLLYTNSGQTTTERFYFNSSVNYAAAFSDISLSENDFFIRTKDYYNRTW
jgi:hypothetical protein